MAFRFSFTDRHWETLTDITVHVEGGKFMETLRDRNTSRNLLKAEVWESITQLFNQRSGQVVTKKQLQEFYGKRLRKTKQKEDDARLRDMKKYTTKTGGGPGLQHCKLFIF
jgi:hypothetical protein